MKRLYKLIWLLTFFIFACATNTPTQITIIDGEQIFSLETDQRVAALILVEAGIQFLPSDRVFADGVSYQLNEALPANLHQLQLRRTMDITLNNQAMQTSATTIADVLTESGYRLTANDTTTPPLNSLIVDSVPITFSPAQLLTITANGQVIQIHSSANTVAKALAEAGIPLVGIDISYPSENEALPADGQIRLVKVKESIEVKLESIPFSIEEIVSDEVAFGQDEIIEAGINGVAMIRTRVRYEDGVEVSRMQEDKTILQEPKTQIVASGTKIVLSPIGGDTPYQYWYATEMYASWYSPCNSGTGGCSYGTASGARAGYGIVAVDYSIYSDLAGMRVYIPGYGVATIGDTGGGPIIETTFGVPRTKWIDLGYDDNNIGGLSGWVTVYFLEPAPATIPYFLK
ncbi:MAG: G5 domain protein [Chloroflexi bacterium OLB14]|nr:MAG: G5 domain protein [Chloroflexi bacterium OLB14]